MSWTTRPRRRECASRSGFTITELLVVIASLAILAAILLPMFCRTRTLSYRAQCACNLRQLGAAFSQYSLDWNGYWPGPGGLYGDRNYWSQSGNGGLQVYIKNRGLGSAWCCPLLTEWHGQFEPRSYSMNSYLRTPCDIEYPRCVEYPMCLSCQCGVRVADLACPVNTILLFEGMPLTGGLEDKLDYLYRCANWTRVRGWMSNMIGTIDSGHPWHGRVNNYLYCDGHLVARPPGRPVVTRGTALQGSLTSYSEMRQWYVSKTHFESLFNDYYGRYVARD